MPKIKITEVDTTGQISSESTSSTVYIPCASSEETEPALVSTVKELEALTGLTTTGKEYLLARRLLRLGMKVLIEGIGSAATVPAKSWTRLQDKTLYDVRFLTTGSCTDEVDANEIACASARGDCIALVDHKDTITLASGETYASAVRNALGVDASGGIDGGDYATAFTPWIKVKDSQDFTEETTVPGSFGYLLAYAHSVRSGIAEYLAMANKTRGSIPELTSVLHTYTQAEIEILQSRSSTSEVGLDDESDNVGIAVNPIAWVRPFGYVIWGNRTLHYNTKDTDSTGLLKASSFLSIRNMACTIKKEMYDAARKFTFDQNGEVLWTNFQNEIIPTLDAMQSGNGILGYRFERLATTKKARLNAKLTVVPVEPAEDFELELELADSLTVTE